MYLEVSFMILRPDAVQYVHYMSELKYHCGREITPTFEENTTKV